MSAGHPRRSTRSLDSWKQYKLEEAFKKAIARMVENFEEQCQDSLALVNSEPFKQNSPRLLPAQYTSTRAK
ncbi:LeoA/HP0731 family dynamin-like GTPase [Pseudomonas guariconensis]|uniref:LeoA/HP0731 family dynamin-like GTPase n=1 Tax=Pseudomonas guariconensis TaxID=1288410 RepID=UPI003B97F91F